MKYLLLRVFAFMILGGVAAGVIFGLAGRWDLWNVWAFIGLNVVLLSFVALVEYRSNPDLLKEGSEPIAPGHVRWSRIPGMLTILQWIIAGLDQRFHWSTVIPASLILTGLVIFALSWGLGAWARSVNPFFSPTIRIQEERGQRVISAGPYAIVRHPGYVGFLLSLVGTSLALNSLLSILSVFIAVPVITQMTVFEDRMLQNGLAGYADYAAKVRYRLIPGIW